MSAIWCGNRTNGPDLETDGWDAWPGKRVTIWGNIVNLCSLLCNVPLLGSGLVKEP